MGFGSEPDEREGERPRPRVVDKRVSAGGTQTRSPKQPEPEAPAAPPGAPAAGAPPQNVGTQRSEADTRAAHPSGSEVWTPEQEAEAMQMARQVVETPSLEWVVNSAVSLANIAATKLDMGAPADSSLAIDALAGILKEVGHRLGDVEQPLKQTLAQLQMAYAERLTSGAQPPGAPGPQ